MRLDGIFIPNVTPFNHNGDIDTEAFSRLVDAWLGTGISGLVVNASTGEGPLLSREEQISMLELAIEKLGGRAMVIAGTGVVGTRETIELTGDARDCGVEAALIVTPYFFRPTDEELFQHYSSILGAVDLPVIIYNVPKFTGYSIKPSVIERIAEEHSGLVGVKDSSGDPGLVAEIIRLVGDKVNVLSGAADVILPTLNLGGRGAILAIANFAPDVCVSLYSAFKAGNQIEVGNLQLKASFINKVLVRDHSQVAAIKAAMNQKGWRAGIPRRPLLPLPQREEREVIEALQSGGFLGERS